MPCKEPGQSPSGWGCPISNIAVGSGVGEEIHRMMSMTSIKTKENGDVGSLVMVRIDIRT